MAKKYLSIYIVIVIILNYAITLKPAFAGPSDGTYELKDYGFGSGGTQNSSDGTYQLQAISGEIESASPSSLNYAVLPGLTYTLQPNTPPAPTFANLASNYNLLNLIIDTANNPSDTTYAIMVSTDPLFQTNVQYVQNSNALEPLPIGKPALYGQIAAGRPTAD